MIHEFKAQTKEILERIERFQADPNWRLRDCKTQVYGMETPTLPDIDRIAISVQTYRFHCRFNTVTIHLHWLGDLIIRVQMQTSGLEIQRYMEQLFEHPFESQEAFAPDDHDFTLMMLDSIQNMSKVV